MLWACFIVNFQTSAFLLQLFNYLCFFKKNHSYENKYAFNCLGLICFKNMLTKHIENFRKFGENITPEIWVISITKDIISHITYNLYIWLVIFMNDISSLFHKSKYFNRYITGIMLPLRRPHYSPLPKE